MLRTWEDAMLPMLITRHSLAKVGQSAHPRRSAQTLLLLDRSCKVAIWNREAQRRTFRHMTSSMPSDGLAIGPYGLRLNNMITRKRYVGIHESRCLTARGVRSLLTLPATPAASSCLYLCWLSGSSSFHDIISCAVF